MFAKRLLRLAIALFTFAIILFLVTSVFVSLGGGFAAALMAKLGAICLLGACSLLIFLAIAQMGIKTIASVCNYFSLLKRTERKLHATLMKQTRQQFEFNEKIRYINYMASFKRQLLLNKDDAIQLQQLAYALKKQLKQTRQQLTKQEWQILQQNYRQCVKNKDCNGLVRLQNRLYLKNADDV